MAAETGVLGDSIMGRNSGSDLDDLDTNGRMTSAITEKSCGTASGGSQRSESFSAVEDFTSEGPFEVFAAALRRELDPRTRLERVLADRAVLSAWALQEAGARELVAIRKSLPDGSLETSPREAFLDVQCLGSCLDLLRRFREDTQAQPRQDRREVFPATRTTSNGWLDPSDPDGDASYDRDQLNRDALSNEWPVVPRGRKVVPEPDSVARTSDSGETALLAECWHDRLVFDFKVSEHSPVVRGTWVTVSHVVTLIVDGWTWSDILRTHPELNVDDIRTCLAYSVAESNSDL